MNESLTTGRIKFKIAQISALAEDMSGVMIVHDLRKWTIVYISPKGCKELGLSLAEISSLTMDEYHERFFNQEDAAHYLPKIKDLLLRNSDETLTFFQQVRVNQNPEWKWYISSVKILLWDEKKEPLLTLTLSFPVDNITQVSAKARRVIDENNFLRNHALDFSKLGKRESEILKLMALGKSSVQIAEELFISAATAKTHRRNIMQKLKTRSFYELSQYARAFDLI